MKNLILVLGLFFLSGSVFAQFQPLQIDKNASSFFKTNNGTIIKARSYTASTNDTTEILSLANHKTIYISVQSQDSTTILIDYALSNDGGNFTAFTVKDSLSFSAAGVGFKSVDFSSTTLGAAYARFRFRHSANAFAVGTTSANYNATYLFKKE